MSEKREAFLDVAKALGIICVCIGHAGVYNFGVTWVNIFHMPLFYFISGYLYKGNTKHPFIQVKKSFKSYYIPYLFYGLGYLLFHNLFVKLYLVDAENGEGWYTLKEYMEHTKDVVFHFHREYFSGALWFLVAILFITIGFAFQKYFINLFALDKYEVPIIIVIAIACMVLSKSNIEGLHLVLERSLEGVFFFTFGHLFKRFGWNSRLIRHRKRVACISVITITIIAFLNEQDFFANVYNNIFARVIGGSLGIALIIMIAQAKVLCYSKCLNKIGKSTLEIMALHFLAFKIVSLMIVVIHELPIESLAQYPTITGIGGCWWMLYTVVGVLVPFGISTTWNKIKGGKKGCWDGKFSNRVR